MSDELEEFYTQVGRQAPSPERTRRDSAVDSSPAGYTAPIGLGPASAWAISGDRYSGISQSLPTLPPGCYRVGQSPDVGVYLQHQALETDALLLLPDSKSELIVSEIEQFTRLRPAFESRGLLYKRGVLLWGPPGSGKTSTLHFLMRLIVDRGKGIAVLLEHPSLAGSALRLIRKIEPTRQVIGILEDFDGLIASHGIEEYLSLLDGETQIDNVVFVATTNYPERLDRRLVDRPSRFDTVEYVGMPSADARRLYITTKEPSLPVDDVEEMVRVSDGLSIAHVRELIILTQCFGRPIADAAKRLNAARHRAPSSERSPERTSLGFGG